jgi:hypothetical protein
MGTCNSPDEERTTHKIRFTTDEDIALAELVAKYGEGDWLTIARHMRNRSVRQCRERWYNYLTPSVSNGPWSSEDDALLLEKCREFGSKWKMLTGFFPGKTDINIKNHYMTLTRHHCRAPPHICAIDRAIASEVPAPAERTDVKPQPQQLPARVPGFEPELGRIQWSYLTESSGEGTLANAKQRNLGRDFYFLFEGF